MTISRAPAGTIPERDPEAVNRSSVSLATVPGSLIPTTEVCPSGSFTAKSRNPLAVSCNGLTILAPSATTRGVYLVGIGDRDVDHAALGAAHFVRRSERSNQIVGSSGSEHDHPSAQSQFGVSDRSIFALVNCLALESKDPAQLLDCGRRIVITMPGDDTTPILPHGGLRLKINLIRIAWATANS